MPTFDVSDVAVERKLLRSGAAEASLSARLRQSVQALASNQVTLGTCVGHPFVEAVSAAYRHHLPLMLSPDDIWLCVVQGIGHHVNANAEHLRHRIVPHDGRLKLEVRRDDFVLDAPGNDWAGVFEEFARRLEANIGDAGRPFVGGFSTTGAVERAAFQIALMSAMKSYFDYSLLTLCGIPRISLLGTPGDWQEIRRRAEGIREFGLKDWERALLPVLDQFVAAAQGRADREFWRSFYKFEDRSGGAPVTGWINVLFPYCEADAGSGDGRLVPNPCAMDWSKASRGGEDAPLQHEFGSGLARAPLRWTYLMRTIPLAVVGGFIDLSQDPQTLAVRPAIGWAVCREPPEGRSDNGWLARLFGRGRGVRPPD